MKISRVVERLIWISFYVVSFLIYISFSSSFWGNFTRRDCEKLGYVPKNQKVVSECLDIQKLQSSDVLNPISPNCDCDTVQISGSYNDELLSKFLSIFKIRENFFMEYLEYASQVREFFPGDCSKNDNLKGCNLHGLFYRFFLVHCYLVEIGKMSNRYFLTWRVDGQKNVGRIHIDTFFKKVLKDGLISNKTKTYENCIEWDIRYLNEFRGLCKNLWEMKYKKDTPKLDWGKKKVYMDLDNNYPPEAEGLFDLIVMTNVHEHLTTVETSSRNLGKITKRGGYLLVVAPHSSFTHIHVEDNYRYTLSGLYHALNRFGGFCAQNLYKLGNIYTHLAETMKFDLKKFPSWLRHKEDKSKFDLYPYSSGVYFRPRNGEECNFEKYPIPLNELGIERL